MRHGRGEKTFSNGEIRTGNFWNGRELGPFVIQLPGRAVETRFYSHGSEVKEEDLNESELAGVRCFGRAEPMPPRSASPRG